VRLAEIASGATVLVSGGAGSVAHYAIQLAKRRGARIIATVSGDAKAAHARAAGADETVNYRTEDVGERIKKLTGGHGVDTVIELDLAANAKTYPAILRSHGTVVVYGTGAPESAIPGGWLMQNTTAIKLFLIYEIAPADRKAGIAELTELLAQGSLIHTVARRYPLDAIAAAHDACEKGEVMGNIVLDI
jgi:NADPH2:quinone reductase